MPRFRYLVRFIISQTQPGTPSSKWLSRPTLENSSIFSLLAIIRLLFNWASPPLTAVNIDSVAGSKTTPTIGSPSYTAAILMVKKSIRCAKLFVPSIGSMAHQSSSSPRGGCLNILPWSPSSAIKPWSGYVSLIRSMIIFWHRASACVTSSVAFFTEALI